MGTRLPALDGFRAYAILGIVALHVLGASGVLRAASGTTEGVVLWSIFGNNIDSFFIISGLVLFLPCVRRRGEFGSGVKFIVSRAARILPAYWFLLALLLVLIVVAPSVAGSPFPSATSLTSHIFLAHTPVRMVFPEVLHGFGLAGPVWMLSIVFSLYLLMPLVARAFYRHPFIGLAAAALVTIGWKWTINTFPEAFAAISRGGLPEPVVARVAIDQLPGWIFSFALGMWLAWAYFAANDRYPASQLRRWAVLALPGALSLFALGAYFFGETSLVYPGLFGGIARSDIAETLLGTVGRGAIVGVVLLGPLWMQRPFVGPITKKLAELSYGMYLIHFVVIVCAGNLLGIPNNGSLRALFLWACVVFPVSIAYALLSRRFIELPAQQWVRARIEMRSSPRHRPATAES